MKDLAALGKCGGLLDNNRNKTSVHSNKQVWQTPADHGSVCGASHDGRAEFKC